MQLIPFEEAWKLYLLIPTVDPYLVLDGDIRLQAVCTKPGDKICYGSHADEASAMKSLFEIEAKDQQQKDAVSSHLVSYLGTSSQEEVSNMKAQLSQCFLPDDEYPMGTQQPFSQMDIKAFDEVILHADSANEDHLDQCGSQSDHKTVDSLGIISVSQLLESVVETAQHVESILNSSLTLTFDEIKNQREALVKVKQQKMSVLQSLKEKQEAMAIISSSEHTSVTSNHVRISIYI